MGIVGINNFFVNSVLTDDLILTENLIFVANIFSFFSFGTMIKITKFIPVKLLSIGKKQRRSNDRNKN